MPYSFQKPDAKSIQSETDIIRTSFSLFHHFFGSHPWLRILMLLFSCFMIAITLHDYLPEYIDYRSWFFFSNFFDTDLPAYIPLLHILNMTIVLMVVAWHIHTQVTDQPGTLIRFWFRHVYKALLTAVLLYPIFMINTDLFLFTMILVLGCLSFIGSVLLIIFSVSVLEDINIFSAIGKTFYYLGGQYMNVVGICAAMCTFMSLYYLFIESPFTYFFIEFILLNIQMDPQTLRWFFISFYTILHYAGICFLLPLALYGTIWQLFSLKEIKHAQHLTKKIKETWM